MFGSKHASQEILGAKSSTAAQLREPDTSLQCELGGGAKPWLLSA